MRVWEIKKGGLGAAIMAMSLVFLSACGSSETLSSDLGASSGGSGGGTGISNTFSSPSEMSVGDLMSVEFGDATSASVNFSGAPSDANFILTVGSYNSSGGGTMMQLAADIALPEGDPLVKGVAVESPAVEDDGADDGYGPQEILSAWLRAAEAALPSTEDAPPALSSGVGAFKAMGVAKAAMGDVETFRVLSSLSSASSYVEVTGRVRCVGAKVLFYVDTSVSSDVLGDSDVETLCTEFDAVAVTEQDLFGETSDVDGDGKLHILMTKQINKLGALGGGIITGYFYAADLYSRSSSNSVSNYREIIYTMVPDPSGQYGTQISKQFAMSNLLPAVLPHELQHAISYNQHVFVNGGSSEENWLNEGMSHLAEDVMGYNRENPSRYAMYLASPSTTGIVTQGSPNLLERGGSYLFLRFLYEQAADGEAFLSALERTGNRGVENLEAAFQGPSNFNEFSEFMVRWTIALAMTDRGISSDSRYNYRERTKNATTGNWEGVCLSCDADDGRGTTLNGVNLNSYYGSHSPSIDASAAIFYNVTTLPDEINIAGTEGGGNYGVLIRTQ